MDTPVRKYQKQKDYQRHKLFRKMKRRRKAAIEQAKDAPMKPLRRKLKIPKFDDGKDDKPNVFQLADGTFVNNHNEPLEVLDYAGVEDPTKWTYVDKKGNRYTPKATRTLTEGEQFTQRQIENEQNTRPFEFTPYIEGANEGAAAASLMMGFPFNMAGSAYYTAKASRDAYNRNYLEAILHGLGAVTPTGSGMWQATKTAANNIYNRLPWTYRIPENPNMAYRRMGPLERDWLMEGNELSTRETNALTEAEEEAAKLDPKYTTKSGFKFNFFKAGAEHGGRKQFAKGQPWRGTTVTHGEEQVLAIPGEGLPWVSGRHYKGPQGTGFKVRDIPFEEAPFGSHIDLLTEEGYTGVNPSLLDGSVIYSPFKIFGHNFGYKKLYPRSTTPQITAENAANITPTEGNVIASGYSINLQEALDNPAFDFTPTGVSRTWWDIMSRKKPDLALSRWEKLGKDLDVKNPIYTDRTGAEDAKNIFNSDWYQKRLADRVSNPEEVTSTFNTRIDKTPLIIQDPGIGFGMEAAGKNISKVERGIGLDGKEKVIVDNKILLHPDMVGKMGDYKYSPENYLDDVVKHETLHASSGTGHALPREVRANNYKYHMTPKYSRESNPSMYDYMSVDDEQRTRLLKFAELAETKFGGDYNKAFDYVNDHYYNWAKDGISHDVLDLVTNFNKEDVVNSASNILGWVAPLAGGTALFGYNSLGQPAGTYKHGKDSGIHINPKNRGKFNALKKRTGKTTEQLTHSKNPLTRKRAIFAQNAKKFKH